MVRDSGDLERYRELAYGLENNAVNQGFLQSRPELQAGDYDWLRRVYRTCQSTANLAWTPV